MACSKYTITNTGSTAVNFNYRRCDDSMWEYQVELLPNETKNIWSINGTYSSAFNSGINLVNEGAFPPVNPTPTPTPSATVQVTPTVTPTVTITPSTTPTPMCFNFWINQTFNPENPNNVYAVGSGMDSNCNSFILMVDYWTSPNNPNQDSSQNFLLQKFNDAGDLVWNRVFDFEEDGTTYSDMDVQTMSVDKEDNVICFVIIFFPSNARRTGIVKFDNDGNQLWSKVLFADLPEDVYNAEMVNSIAFDASNNMYVSLSIYDPATPPNGFTRIKKISPEGVVLASKTITFTSYCGDVFLNVNSIGEVYLVALNSTSPDYKNHIIKLDSSLNEIWNKSFVPSNNNSYLYGIAFDKDENIVFQTGNGAGANANPLYGAYIKVSPDGEVIWTTRISNIVNPDYSLGTYQLNSDNDGNVYISSIFPQEIPDYPGSSNSLIVAKLSPAGAFEWAYFVQPPSGTEIDSWYWYTPIAGNVVNNSLILGYYDNVDPFNAQLFKLPLTPVADGVYGDYTFTNITDQWTTSSPALTLSADTVVYSAGSTDTSALTYITFSGNTYTTIHTSLPEPPIVTPTPTPTFVPPTPFISVWRTTSPDESITLPYAPSGQYEGTIDWGDGNITVNSYTNITHTYTVPGDYTISISGKTRGWAFYNTVGIEGNNAKIISVVQWGSQLRVTNTGGPNGHQFYACINLDLSGVTDVLNLTGVIGLGSMFYGCTSLTTINRINEWNVSKITDMSSMFYGTTSFNQNIGAWDVSKVVYMLSMFSEAAAFNNGDSLDINNWNTSNVITMQYMFYEADSFNQPIGNWNVSKVTNMVAMFNHATSFNQNIGNWDVSGVTHMPNMFVSALAFNNGGSSSINNWNTSSVINMNDMFAAAQSFNQPIGSWDVSKVSQMQYMFTSAIVFNQDISGWDVSSVTSMRYMFNNASSFNQDISGWDVGSVTNMQNMFQNATSFNQDLSSWCVALIPSTPPSFATGATSWVLPQPVWGTCSTVDAFISTWRTTTPSESISLAYGYMGNGSYTGFIDWGDGTITPNSYANSTHTYAVAGDYIVKVYGEISDWSFANSFANPNKIRSISQWGSKFRLSVLGYNFFNCVNLDLSSVTDLLTFTNPVVNFLFYNCTSLTTVNRITEWDLSNVTNVTGMFYGCTNFNQDLNGLNVSSITNMNYMFYNASSFNGNISGWDTSNVTSMGVMFGSALAFNGNISNWNTSKVTTMYAMFQNASSFNGNIGGWDVSKVTTMQQMFESATAFNNGGSSSINNWNTENVLNMSRMFGDATVFNQPIGGWNTSKVTTIAGIFSILYGGVSAFNQNIGNWNTSNVTDMQQMFENATLFNQNIGSWNTSKVNTMQSMFKSAFSFNQNIGNWNTSNVTDMQQMFENATLFNQNLSGWCVTLIPSAPTNFATGATAWVLPKPVWGTCPA